MVSFEQPNSAVVKEAASVSFYDGATGKGFSCVQLLTIDGLLDNTQRSGNLFIPFLAATLLCLNKRVAFPRALRSDNVMAKRLTVLTRSECQSSNPWIEIRSPCNAVQRAKDSSARVLEASS